MALLGTFSKLLRAKGWFSKLLLPDSVGWFSRHFIGKATTIGVVQHVGPKSVSTGTTLTSDALGAAVVVNNTAVAVIVHEGTTGNRTVTRVQDSAGGDSNVGDWILCKRSGYSGGHDCCEIWARPVLPNASAFTVTVTVDATAYITILTVAEASPCRPADFLDGSGATDTLSPSETGPVAVSGPGLLVAAFASGTMGFSPVLPQTFTRLDKSQSGGTNEDGDSAYKVVTALNSGIDPKWGTGSGPAVAVVLKQGPSVPDIDPPAVSPTTSINEGASTAYTISGTFTDDAAESPWTGLIDWGDGNTSTATIGSGTYSLSGNHTYATAGIYSITARITNTDGHTGISPGTTVTVSNVAPVVGTPSVTPTTASKRVATTFTVTGTFTDAGAASDATYLGCVDWGDGTGSKVTITGSGNPYSYSFIGSHTYLYAGTAAVRVRVRDKYGALGSSATVNVVASVATGYYNASWIYQRKITVDNSGGTFNLDYYQLPLTLDGSNFTFGHARSDGGDLRYTRDDGTTLLDHWIEHYDGANSTAHVTVALRDIPAGATQDIYEYYGNAGATSASSAAAALNVAPSGGPPATTPQTAQRIEVPPGTDGVDGAHSSGSVAFVRASGDWVVLYGVLKIADSPPFVKARKCVSTNGGTSWTCTDLTVSGLPTVPTAVVPSASGTLANGRWLVWLNAQAGIAANSDTYMIGSDDEGVTWFSLQYIQDPFAGAGGDNSFEVGGNIIELTPGGTVWAQAVVTNAGSTYSTGVIYESTDGGLSFHLLGGSVATASYSGAQNSNPGSQFAGMCRVDANTVVIVAYTGHTTQGNPIYVARTTDAGATWAWGPMVDAGLVNNSATYSGEAPRIVRLANGHLVVWATDRSNLTISAYVSRDDGVHFERRNDIIDASGAFQVGQIESFAFAPLNDGVTMLACYVFGSILAQDATYWTTFTGPYLLGEWYDDMEAGVTAWSNQTGAAPTQDTAHALSGTHALKLQAGATGAAFVPQAFPTNSTVARHRAITAWVYVDSLAGNYAVRVNYADSFTSQYFELVTVATTGELQWNDLGTPTSFSPSVFLTANVWHKLTIVYDQLTGTASAYLDNALAGTAGVVTQAQAGAGAILYATFQQSGTSSPLWVDDAYSSQWLDAPPALTVGSEVQTGGQTFSGAGGSTATGALAKQIARALAGGSTATGALTRADAKPLAGSVTAAAALKNAGAKPLAGSVAPTGAPRKAGAKPLAGSTTATGALGRVRAAVLAVAGAITAAGAVATVRAALLAVGGAVAAAGAVTRAGTKALGGSTTPAGTAAKAGAKPLAGGTTATGALGRVRAALLAVGGAVTAAGALAKALARALAGLLTGSGRLTTTGGSAPVTAELAGSVTMRTTLDARVTIRPTLSGTVTMR
jgi:hypothetical protein